MQLTGIIVNPTAFKPTFADHLLAAYLAVVG